MRQLSYLLYRTQKQGALDLYTNIYKISTRAIHLDLMSLVKNFLTERRWDDKTNKTVCGCEKPSESFKMGF